MVGRLDDLLARLREERALPQEQRGTGAADRPLDGAIDKVARARDLVAAGDTSAAARLMAEVSHQVVDSWSYSSSLSAEVVECSQALARS